MTTALLIIIYVDLDNNSLRNLLDVFPSATQLPNYVISGLMWGGVGLGLDFRFGWSERKSTLRPNRHQR